jgi:hypothetical protein
VHLHVHAVQAPLRAAGNGRGVSNEHVADPKNANIIAFPDLPPKGSRGGRGKGTLLGPPLGTSFDMGQRLFAYYGEGDVFLER